MPQSAWSDKRERQYEHIKEGLVERGTGEDTAKEIAARTVNKDRAQHGEAREASRTSIEDMSPGRRVGCDHTAARVVGPTTSFATRPGSAGSRAARA